VQLTGTFRDANQRFQKDVALSKEQQQRTRVRQVAPNKTLWMGTFYAELVECPVD
jgi:hypothetical protein